MSDLRKAWVVGWLLVVLGPAMGCLPGIDPAGPEMLDEDELEDVELEDGSISLVDVRFDLMAKGEYFANLAHLQGRDVGGVTLYFSSGMILRNESSQARTATVNIVLQGYSQIATQLVEVPANGTVEVAPMNPTMDFEALYEVTTPVSANIQIEIREGQSLVDLRVETVQIQPMNRFRWFWEQDGEYADMRMLVAVLATPEDRGNEVQKLLTEAAQYTSTGSIHGYQGNSEFDAYDQAAAIYYALQNRGMVYTDVSGSFFDGAQNVKTPAQSLSTGSANCVDGMLVFASAFEAMGMRAILFFVSGHAFVGLWLGRGEDASFIAIETTLVASATFEQALAQGKANIEAALANGDPLWASMNLAAIREIGITPVNL